jgi:hypothetical protein
MYTIDRGTGGYGPKVGFGTASRDKGGSIRKEGGYVPGPG